MTLLYEKQYREVLKLLRQKCAPTLPVIVRRMKIGTQAGLIADCRIGTNAAGDPRTFVIRISSLLPPISQVDALIHEWAHTLSWDVDHALHQHGRGWEAAMGRCYRVYARWCGKD